MPRVTFTGRGSLKFILGAAGIADVSAPKTTEIAAGVELVDSLTRDGLSTPNTGNTVDASDAGDRFNKTAPGTFGGDALSCTFQTESLLDDDVAWTTLVQDTIGYLVVCRLGYAQDAASGLGTKTGTPAAGDRVEVYPVMVISQAPQDTGDSTNRFTVSLSVFAAPDLHAVLAAAA